MTMRSSRTPKMPRGDAARLVASAIDSAALAEKLGLAHDRIVLSRKVSGVQDLIAVYRDLAARRLLMPCTLA